MDQFERYAVYFMPRPGPLADFGARWLGWDVERGAPVAHPELGDLPRPIAEITQTPRKYGLHGTIKPPFRLNNGHTAQDLNHALATLCAEMAPPKITAMSLATIGRFLALKPQGNTDALNLLAGQTVQALDRFRAPATEAELARRRAAKLSAAQDALLVKWGYPYVMDQFRFHITLTGRLADPELAQIKTALSPIFTPMLQTPFPFQDLCLAGEDAQGRFHLIHRHTLSG